jgi:hypothetical protein
MIALVKIISTATDALRRRVPKFLRFGKGDVQTALEVAPSGIDGNPEKDMIAVYAPTSENGKTVIIGYINANQKAEAGELRLFCTASGTEKFYVWLKKNGTLELGGATNYAVKFNELKSEFDKLKTDHNELAQKWNAFCTAYVPGSPSTVGLPPTLATSSVTPNASDIDLAKNEKIKTIG